MPPNISVKLIGVTGPALEVNGPQDDARSLALRQMESRSREAAGPILLAPNPRRIQPKPKRELVPRPGLEPPHTVEEGCCELQGRSEVVVAAGCQGQQIGAIVGAEVGWLPRILIGHARQMLRKTFQWVGGLSRQR